MKKFILGLGVLSCTLLSVGNASAAVTYSFGLKADDLSNYEAFAVGQVRCGDAGSKTIYQVDADLGCEAAGFLIADIEPSEEATFQPGIDSVLLTVLSTDDGEAFSGKITFTLVDPQAFIPVSGNLKAGPTTRFGDFAFEDMGNGVYEGIFNTCSYQGDICKGISNIEITFNEVPVPAAAWLFGSALIGLAGLKRKQS